MPTDSDPRSEDTAGGYPTGTVLRDGATSNLVVVIATRLDGVVLAVDAGTGPAPQLHRWTELVAYPPERAFSATGHTVAADLIWDNAPTVAPVPVPDSGVGAHAVCEHGRWTVLATTPTLVCVPERGVGPAHACEGVTVLPGPPRLPTPANTCLPSQVVWLQDATGRWGMWVLSTAASGFDVTAVPVAHTPEGEPVLVGQPPVRLRGTSASFHVGDGHGLLDRFRRGDRTPAGAVVRVVGADGRKVFRVVLIDPPGSRTRRGVLLVGAESPRAFRLPTVEDLWVDLSHPIDAPADRVTAVEGALSAGATRALQAACTGQGFAGAGAVVWAAPSVGGASRRPVVIAGVDGEGVATCVSLGTLREGVDAVQVHTVGQLGRQGRRTRVWPSHVSRLPAGELGPVVAWLAAQSAGVVQDCVPELSPVAWVDAEKRAMGIRAAADVGVPVPVQVSLVVDHGVVARTPWGSLVTAPADRLVAGWQRWAAPGMVLSGIVDGDRVDCRLRQLGPGAAPTPNSSGRHTPSEPGRAPAVGHECVATVAGTSPRGLVVRLNDSGVQAHLADADLLPGSTPAGRRLWVGMQVPVRVLAVTGDGNVSVRAAWSGSSPVDDTVKAVGKSAVLAVAASWNLAAVHVPGAPTPAVVVLPADERYAAGAELKLVRAGKCVVAGLPVYAPKTLAAAASKVLSKRSVAREGRVIRVDKAGVIVALDGGLTGFLPKAKFRGAGRLEVGDQVSVVVRQGTCAADFTLGVAPAQAGKDTSVTVGHTPQTPPDFTAEWAVGERVTAAVVKLGDHQMQVRLDEGTTWWIPDSSWDPKPVTARSLLCVGDRILVERAVSSKGWKFVTWVEPPGKDAVLAHVSGVCEEGLVVDCQDSSVTLKVGPVAGPPELYVGAPVMTYRDGEELNVYGAATISVKGAVLSARSLRGVAFARDEFDDGPRWRVWVPALRTVAVVGWERGGRTLRATPARLFPEGVAVDVAVDRVHSDGTVFAAGADAVRVGRNTPQFAAYGRGSTAVLFVRGSNQGWQLSNNDPGPSTGEELFGAARRDCEARGLPTGWLLWGRVKVKAAAAKSAVSVSSDAAQVFAVLTSESRATG